MRTKSNFGVAVAVTAALLFVIVVAAVVAAIFMLPIGTGYKVNVSGNASYSGLWPFWLGWSASVSDVTQTKDTFIFATQPGLWFWETGNIIVSVHMGNYVAERTFSGTSTGGGNVVWNVDIRHVEPGSYVGTVSIYELKDSIFGMGGWRDLLCSTTVSYTVTEI